MSMSSHLTLNDAEPLSGTRVEFDAEDYSLPIYVRLGDRAHDSAPLTMCLSLPHAENLLERLLAALTEAKIALAKVEPDDSQVVSMPAQTWER